MKISPSAGQHEHIVRWPTSLTRTKCKPALENRLGLLTQTEPFFSPCLLCMGQTPGLVFAYGQDETTPSIDDLNGLVDIILRLISIYHITEKVSDRRISVQEIDCLMRIRVKVVDVIENGCVDLMIPCWPLQCDSGGGLASGMGLPVDSLDVGAVITCLAIIEGLAQIMLERNHILYRSNLRGANSETIEPFKVQIRLRSSQ